ncbi:MAG: flagellar assembly protein FliW [Planctomycetales bacterium]|nr:flagellar assembly protein FliW [Planctomycetales bacterium]
MQITTSRFGKIDIQSSDILDFPAGLLGLEGCRYWVLLADAENSSLGWLQSTERSDVALAVVSPRRFAPDYQIRISRRDLAPLELPSPREAQVLAIVSKSPEGITANLKAPLLFNLERRVGAQVVTRDEQPIRFKLPTEARSLRRSA